MAWISPLHKLSVRENITNNTTNLVVIKVPSLANHSILTLVKNKCKIPAECRTIFNYYAKTTEVVASIKTPYSTRIHRPTYLASDAFTANHLVDVCFHKQYDEIHKS